jgi:hypothetical protein
MKGFDFLDLVIGLIFIYLIYSIACSTIWELIVNITFLRGHMLRNWILKNFNQAAAKDKLGQLILNHPLIKGLSKDHKHTPTYINSSLFADVLIDLVVSTESETEKSGTPDVVVHADTLPVKSFSLPIDINTFRYSLANTGLLDPGLQRVFLQYISEASGSLTQVKNKISMWFEEAQERLIGSYKKNLQIWIFLIAIFIVGGTNADTFRLANYLYKNDDVRKAMANQAVLFVRDSANLSQIKKIDTLAVDSAASRKQDNIISNIQTNQHTLNDLLDIVNKASIPIGWGMEDLNSYDFFEILKKIGGLLLTVFAVSMGAPFWFDILSNIANLRSSGNKPKEVRADKTDN